MIIIITLWLWTPGPRVVPSQAGQPCEHPLENQKQAWPLCPAQEDYNISSVRFFTVITRERLVEEGSGYGAPDPLPGVANSGHGGGHLDQ